VLGVVPVLILVLLDMHRGEHDMRQVKPCPQCKGVRCILGRFRNDPPYDTDSLKSWANVWEPLEGSHSTLQRGKIVEPQSACLSCGLLFTTLR
jgi:hypothetical protein